MKLTYMKPYNLILCRNFDIQNQKGARSVVLVVRDLQDILNEYKDLYASFDHLVMDGFFPMPRAIDPKAQSNLYHSKKQSNTYD